jgi:acyl carrier protein
LNSAQVLQQLNELFSEIFQRDDLILSPSTTAEDVAGWDSFKQIEIAVAVEEKFSIRLRTRDMTNLKNVGELVDFILEKTSGER